jgi:FtsH-binding integral membrane protein
MNIIKTPTKSFLALFSALLLLVFLSFSIALNSFEKQLFTCKRYILNTYLYIILTFNIMAILCLSLEHNNISFGINLWQFLGIFLVTIGLIIMLKFIDPTNVVFKHFVWLLLILALGLVFYPMFDSIKDKSIILSAAFTTILITLILSAIAFYNPELISFSWGPVLIFLLIAAIIMEVSLLIIYRKDYSKISNLFRISSYFVIFIFIGFILYDTKMLQVRAKACKKADYINESLHLFLDILNIFVRILSLGR